MGVEELYRQGRRAALWGITVSLALGLAKLLAGVLGHSFALVSDAVHSLGDAVTSSALWAALLFSQRPPDPEHPYGHTRAEAVAGSSIALLIVFSALWICWQAVAARMEEEAPESYVLWVAAASAILKEGLYQYKQRVAKKTGSRAVLASAWDHRMDALGSMVVLAGVALARWTGTGWADHGAALGVGVIILFVGGRLFWNSWEELLDRQAEPDILQAVRQEALAVPGVRGVEKLLARKTGLEYLVDIHVEVDPEMTVREGHAIAHAVKDRVVTRLTLVKDVLVHIEPDPSEIRIHV